MPQKLGKKQACGNNRLCDLYYHKAISQKNAGKCEEALDSIEKAMR
ncbi:21204_t:CDS:2 [Entrophospora sp. SA101]|nr:5864_t:CDS:2 [Entrophospora sp. SA101]CAJ0756621.1 21204_t:CDS:2 [Entrophospora sp. SA101]CAJ0835786.1 2251_t:CDS:2 [Entrophospora sp. SA101]CAJ0924475.1 22127_t:CDS:2 [Entrophospora sp. SA101]